MQIRVMENEVCVGEQYDAARTLRLRDLFATLERGYLHDLSTSRHYCGVQCYPRWGVVSGFIVSAVPPNPFELAIAWPKLTVDVASALFVSTWRDHRE